MASNTISAIEKGMGKPITEILIELYQKHGKVALVAQELGVTQSTVSLWIMKHGLEFKTTLVKKSA